MIVPPFTPRLLSLALGSFLLTAPVVRAADPLPVYQRASAPIEARVDDLVARMNAQEKIAQITAHWIPTPKKGQTVDQALTTEFLEKHFAHGIGSIGPCHLGIDARGRQWAAFCVAGLFAGLAGALFAFSKGSISPETLAVPRSVDGLAMVLLGGLQTLTGPVWGAAAFTWLQDAVSREIGYWRAALGGVLLVLVLAFPQGLAGLANRWPSSR